MTDEFDEMTNADWEAIDATEYAQFNAEMDAQEAARRLPIDEI